MKVGKWAGNTEVKRLEVQLMTVASDMFTAKFSAPLI